MKATVCGASPPTKATITIVSGKVKGVTQFVTTRFGNVLGSNGSVIPHFREQIKNGGPITVTDPNIERFFMLIPEACKLVLEAGTMGKGGEIYVFDMGKPVKIVDLAKRMIQLSGARDVKIVFTGLRDGEKLYEEVLASAEMFHLLQDVRPDAADLGGRGGTRDGGVVDEREAGVLGGHAGDVFQAHDAADGVA